MLRGLNDNVEGPSEQYYSALLALQPKQVQQTHSYKQSAISARYAIQSINSCELIPAIDQNKTIQYYKFWELMMVGNIRKSVESSARSATQTLASSTKGPVIRTAHFCEAPGSFITAAYDMWPDRVDWHAMSLKMVGAIDFYHPLIQATRKNGRMRVNFGEDETGNIKVLNNAQRFARDVGHASIDLVTADGNEKESNIVELSHARLAVCEIYASLLILRQGGCLVVRMFDIIERPTVMVLETLNVIFETVHIVRPTSTKAGSKERYVVCQKLRRHTPEFKNALQSFEDYGYHIKPMTAVTSSDSVLANIYRSSADICQRILFDLTRARKLAVYMNAMGLTTTETVNRHATEKLVQSRFKQNEALNFVQHVRNFHEKIT